MKNMIGIINANIYFWVSTAISAAIGGTYATLTVKWLGAVILLSILIVCIVRIIDIHKRHVKKVIFLLDALENNDNAIRFTEKNYNRNDNTISQLLNRVTQILQEAKAESMQQEKYYELILSFINTGILVLNDKGSVIQKNNELLRLLGLEVFTHVRQLSKIDHILMEKLEYAHAGDIFQVVFNNEWSNINLSVRVSGIIIREEHLRIFALNDINSELGEKELDAWTHLIRVLTHEIMNSVTPITSLSDTLLSLSGNMDEEMRKGLQTINTTGKGLLTFVESYRKFTRIPTPEPSLFYVKSFIERMVELTKHQYEFCPVTFDIHTASDDLILHADENLISQVVINLLKNAIEAIGSQPNGRIEIHSYCNEAEEVLIEISNNGVSLTPEIAEQIFVPFFTTKQGGCGIGLSLSRQIMRLSGGSIVLKPAQSDSFTRFLLRFK